MPTHRWPIGALASLLASSAPAEILVGGELGGTIPAERLDHKYTTSLGISATAAHPMHVGGVELRPGVVAGYNRLANPRDASRPAWFYRVGLGGDVRYPGFVVKPLVGAHYGYAWGNGKTLSTAYVGGVAYDWEVGVDFPVDPHVDLGARLRRVVIAGDDAEDARFWVTGIFAAVAY